MSSLGRISDPQREQMRGYHEDYHEKNRSQSCSIVVAALLCLGGLIVITGGCLCLNLPNINVINDIVLKAIVPGLLAITLAIPFIIKSVQESQQKRPIRKKIITTMISHLETNKVARKSRKERIDFILSDLLDWKKDPNKPEKWITPTRGDAVQYQQKILTKIKKKMGEKKAQRNPHQEKIATAIDKAIAKLNKP